MCCRIVRNGLCHICVTFSHEFDGITFKVSAQKNVSHLWYHQKNSPFIITLYTCTSHTQTTTVANPMERKLGRGCFCFNFPFCLCYQAEIPQCFFSQEQSPHWHWKPFQAFHLFWIVQRVSNAPAPLPLWSVVFHGLSTTPPFYPILERYYKFQKRLLVSKSKIQC